MANPVFVDAKIRALSNDGDSAYGFLVPRAWGRPISRSSKSVINSAWTLATSEHPWFASVTLAWLPRRVPRLRFDRRGRMKRGGRKQMRLTPPDQSKTVTVSDGTVATVRRPRGGDVVRAQEIAVGDNKFSSPARCWSSLLASSGFFARQPKERRARMTEKDL